MIMETEMMERARIEVGGSWMFDDDGFYQSLFDTQKEHNLMLSYLSQVDIKTLPVEDFEAFELHNDDFTCS